MSGDRGMWQRAFRGPQFGSQYALGRAPWRIDSTSAAAIVFSRSNESKYVCECLRRRARALPTITSRNPLGVTCPRACNVGGTWRRITSASNSCKCVD